MSSFKKRYRRASKTRDPKLIIIASEGQETEPNYFDEIISHENYGRSGVFVITLRRSYSNSSPKSVLNQLKSAKKEFSLKYDDELWIVIDRDKWTDQELNDVAKECQNQNIQIALSNPCFEIWLLMHFCDLHKNNNASICKNKNSLKCELTKILKSKKLISYGMKAYVPHVERAISNAIKMDKQPQERWPLSIGTRVYVLVNNIIKS